LSPFTRQEQPGRPATHVSRHETWRLRRRVAEVPNGALIPADDDFRVRLPRAPSEWLFTRRPGELFGGAASFGLASGFVLGVVGGLAFCPYRLLDSPVDVTRAPSPVASLVTDRATEVTRGVVITVFGIVGSLVLTSVLPSSELRDPGQFGVPGPGEGLPPTSAYLPSHRILITSHRRLSNQQGSVIR
jgi:hypothetical protein